MSFSVRKLLAVLFLLLSVTAPLFAQTTTKQPSKVPNGSVSGRVTIKEKGAPGVVVGLRKSEGATPAEPYQRAITDQEGLYRISNLPPGSYAVTVSAPAYVTVSMRNEAFKTVLLGEDENVEGINFKLERGGVITGRVTDAEGRAVIEQQVIIYPAPVPEPTPQQRAAVYPAQTVQTDDRGVYRVFGLRPGRYVVAVGKSLDDVTVTYVQTRAPYSQVFHPDVSEMSKATVIEVSEGSEANNVDIALGRVLQLFTVSGRVINENGQPEQSLRVGVRRVIGNRAEYVNSFGVSNKAGDFVIEGVVPGKYGTFLFNPQSGMYAETVLFDVTDQDVGGLIVKLAKGASVAGVVVLQSEDKSAFQKLAQLQLRASVMDRERRTIFNSSAASPIGPDGSFYLTGLGSGTLNLHLALSQTPGEPKGFTITRIETDGTVLPRIDISEGQQLSGLRVFVSYGSAIVRGVVRFENGSLPPGRVFIRVVKPGERLSNIRSPMVDERGHFIIEGLPGGTYEIHAMINMGGRNHPLKQEVTVQEGQVTQMEFRVDLSALQKP